MKILADECCDIELVASLREDGHDVSYVLERIAGVTDDEVLLAVYNEGRILLAEDKDFGELAKIWLLAEIKNIHLNLPLIFVLTIGPP